MPGRIQNLGYSHQINQKRKTTTKSVVTLVFEITGQIKGNIKMEQITTGKRDLVSKPIGN